MQQDATRSDDRSGGAKIVLATVGTLGDLHPFIAIGLVFSSLTRNQIVAAVLTFVTLLVLMVMMWVQNFEDLGPVVRAALRRLAYWDLWSEALRGRLSVRDLILQLSMAVFGLFLTVKILEARKWS